MKTAWVFPVNQPCGISFYSHRYVAALHELIAVDSFDLAACLRSSSSLADTLNAYDCVHLQYEPSFFAAGASRSYERFRRRITRPLIVSLHEVHDEFPGVFPRGNISGRGWIRTLKEGIYDLRHPLQTLYRRHLSEKFYADAVIVHAHFQKEILVAHGIDAHRIDIIPMPIPQPGKPSVGPRPAPSGTPAVTRLSSLGFINRHYQYDLLFAVLDKLDFPWRFTWIGGLRQTRDRPLLDSLRRDIAARGWDEQFVITGWVADETRDGLLANTDIYLALFSARSSSLSLATAIGAGTPIVATALPVTQELVRAAPLMRLTPPDAASAAASIKDLLAHDTARSACRKTMAAYAAHHGYPASAQKLVELYRSVCA